MNTKKTIGIATMWDTPVNYGQVLQGFGLQTVLKDLGYNSFILKYTGKESAIQDTLWVKIKRVLTGKRSLSDYLKRFTSKVQEDSGRHFDEFRAKYMAYSDIEYNYYSDYVNRYQKADAYIAGCDMIWCEYGSLSKKHIFLLDFLPDNIKRISYAASFGRTEIKDSAERKVFENALPKFIAVSCREQSGKDLCIKLGRKDAEWVVDPTFLLCKKRWEEIFNLKKKKRNHKVLLAYFLTNDKENKKLYRMMDIFRNLGYEIKYVSSTRFLDKNSNFNPTIEEWLEEMYTADMVLTSSYHGAIIALNFNTPVISVVKGNPQEGGNVRMYSIFKRIGLEHRMISFDNYQAIEKLEKESINWDKVNSLMDTDRLHSQKFLENALNKI